MHKLISLNEARLQHKINVQKKIADEALHVANREFKKLAAMKRN